MNRRLANFEERKKALTAHIESLLDMEDPETGFSETQQRAYTTAQNELHEVTEGIRLEHERKSYLPTHRTNDFGPDDTPGLLPEHGRMFGNTDTAVQKHGMIGAKYCDLFGPATDTGGWSSYQEYLSQIQSGMADPRLSALSEGSGSAGGFLVPTQYAAERLDAMMENSIVMPRARIYPMTSNEKKIAGFDASTNTTGTLFGGIESQWIGEGDTATVTNPIVRQITLKTKKLALLATTSNEVSEDGQNLDSQLSDALGEANGWFLDYAFLRGDGVGMPLGAANDPALITVDAEAGQDTDTICYENMINMLARLHVACHARAVWVCSPTLIPSLLTLFAPTALTGQHVPVVERVGGSWSMLGKEILFSEKMSSKGDLFDICLADFSQYAIGLRKDMTIERSGHVYFTSDKTAWRAITRLDGQGRWDAAFTPATGDTQSWCVTLAAR
ncbi:MAG: phage major capsid protein [Pirellulales bacterium]|nr:phage major capsid protein [Pirellulales bacterium]